MFTDIILKKLDAKLDPDDIKSRNGAGGKVPYVEGWEVIDKANHYFGFGNWDRETEVWEVHPPVEFTPPPTREHPHPKAQMVSCWRAKVRITVWDEAHQRKCVREGSTAHRSFALTVGEAVENAIKGAETDATKRALVTFGMPFGLALYDKDKKNIGRDDHRQIEQGHERPMAPIDVGFDGEASRRPTNSERALVVANGPKRETNGNGSMRY